MVKVRRVKETARAMGGVFELAVKPVLGRTRVKMGGPDMVVRCGRR